MKREQAAGTRRREQKDTMSNRPIGPEGGKRISYRYFNGTCRTRSIGVLDVLNLECMIGRSLLALCNSNATQAHRVIPLMFTNRLAIV
jgi:hypothetical protein